MFQEGGVRVGFGGGGGLSLGLFFPPVADI